MQEQSGSVVNNMQHTVIIVNGMWAVIWLRGSYFWVFCTSQEIGWVDHLQNDL